MTSKIFSVTINGLSVDLVEVQVDISRGMPVFNIVGLGDTSIKESKERIRSSIKNSGFKFPPIRKTVNLAPARLRKQGTMFDLPIALGILQASQQVPKLSQDSAYLGELSLDGNLNPIKGALPIIAKAKELGLKNIYLPFQNAMEVSFIEDINVYPVRTLKQIVNHTIGIERIRKLSQKPIKQSPPNFLGVDIVGLEMAKRALSIALAGQHNLLLYGSPGCGKTTICRSFKQLMPQMTDQEILQTNSIYSLAGHLNEHKPLIVRRPFREAHNNITVSSILGGGTALQPGEVSLAHNGVLFLDEIAQFSRKTLESLKGPLQDHYVSIKNNHQQVTFPASFTLLANMNPCPCGYHGDPKIRCLCSQSQIKNYQAKLSGPIIDRFDLFIRISNSPLKKLATSSSERMNTLYNQINNARRLQYHRGVINQLLTTKQIVKYCPITLSSQKLLSQAQSSLKLSNRAYLKIIKVSRTIADLENSTDIQDHHLAEALQYRQTF